MSEHAVNIDIKEIMSFLPHRYPFLLIDRVVEFEAGVRLKAIKNVTINEPFFSGHFQHYPVMPGVLLVEALAQAAGILSIRSRDKRLDNEMYFLAGIDNARFKRQVIPGDQLELHVEEVSCKRGVAKYLARGLVSGLIACQAEIMCAMREV